MFHFLLQPGYCNSQVPWYLSKPMTLSPHFGIEEDNELCMTDITSRNTAVCCQQPIKVLVRSCGVFFIYKIIEKLPFFSHGQLCGSGNYSSISECESNETRQDMGTFDIIVLLYLLLKRYIKNTMIHKII